MARSEIEGGPVPRISLHFIRATLADQGRGVHRQRAGLLRGTLPRTGAATTQSTRHQNGNEARGR